MRSLLIRSALALTVATATLTLAAGDAHAALNAYLKLKGQKQGDIKGSVTQKNQEGAINVIAVSHEIISPRDAASGLPTGKRQHKPLRVRLEIDQSMPRLYDALVNNENISELSLPVFGRGKNGRETFLYEIKLRNANIAGIQLESSDDPAKPDTLWVSFTYQKIDWTWADGGVTAQDDWEAPVAAGAPKKPK